MTTPYILPQMLTQLAPLGIDWESIPIAGASKRANLAALLDICYIATDAIDTEVFQPLRSTCDVEELIGPGGDRLVVPPTGNGNAIAFMQHWPITSVLGARISPANTFPPSWQAIAAASLLVGQASAQFVGGSFLGSSGSDGMNEIEMQPGYITWQNGRNGYRAQYAYENGWPTAGLMPSASVLGSLVANSAVITGVIDFTGIAVLAPISCLDVIPDGSTIVAIDETAHTITISQEALESAPYATLQIGYAPGVTSLNIDDVTGMLGAGPTIFDGSFSESVRVLAAAADVPIDVLPGVPAQIGPGVITLASPTRLAHAGTDPASALVSAMPANVRLAAYYYAGSEAMQRGGTAFTVQALPGSLQSSGGTPSIGDLTSQAQNQLQVFKRVF